MIDDVAPWEDSWTEEHAGFPYYMDCDSIDEQKEAIATVLDKAADVASFTPDYPNLALWEDHYLFVYGTLKRTEGNHKVIDNKACKFLATSYTADPHFVMKQTRGGIPVALGSWGDTSAPNKQVKGELYLVKTPMIPKLDVFEQNGVLYRRLKIRITVPQVKAQDELVAAWMYVGVKGAWSDSNESLPVCPSFERVKGETKLPFYTYLGKEVTHESM